MAPLKERRPLAQGAPAGNAVIGKTRPCPVAKRNQLKDAKRYRRPAFHSEAGSHSSADNATKDFAHGWGEWNSLQQALAWVLGFRILAAML